ncbi:5-methylcytosine restriction system specificity protein McrC [Aestuariimicrobium sp. Y1814]|uniref:5-methylcytosine restriction system specificity protein McrC n=1 Tax=Aestuariimicrobium sp. Y1814 TaxID=3418742 RepID=UPI003DA7683E
MGAKFPLRLRWNRGTEIINQINKLSPEPVVAVTVLLDVLTTPVDLDDATRKIQLLATHLESIRVGSHPSASRAPFVASYYWGLDAPTDWPVAWPKSTEYLEYCTGVSTYDDQGDRYAELYRYAMELDGDPLRFEQVTDWWADQRPIVMDPALCDRAALREAADKVTDDPERYRGNARALVAVAQHIGTSLEARISGATGRTLKAHKPSLTWDGVWPRGDLWVDWRVPGTYGLAVRLWLNGRGLAIGLRPYPNGNAGGTERVRALVESHPLPGYELLASGGSRIGKDVGFIGGGSGEAVYARWFGRDALSSLDLPKEVLKTAAAVAPLIAVLAGDTNIGDGADELASIVAEFKASTGYPTAGNEQDQATRRDYAPALGLARLVLTNLTLTDVRGSTTALSFMVDMNDLFQRFVTERLRRELQGRLDLIGEPTVHLGQGQQVAMQPDLVFRAPRGVIRYVGDIKYKLAPDARGRSSDYYQLLAYTTAMDLTEGVLIYCSDSGDTHQSVVTVKHSGKRLVLHSIDLSGTPAQVEHEIATLADAIAASSIGGGTSYVAGDPMAP